MSVIVIVQTFYFLTLHIQSCESICGSAVIQTLRLLKMCSAAAITFSAVPDYLCKTLHLTGVTTSKTHQFKNTSYNLRYSLFLFFFVNTWTPRPHFSADSGVKSEAVWAAGKRIFINWETSYPIHHCLCWLKCSEFFQKPSFFFSFKWFQSM